MDRNDYRKKTATLAALLTYFIFGLSFMASRICLEHTTNSMLLVLRFGMSMIVILILAATGLVRLNLKGKNIRSLLVLGLLFPVIYYIGETNGIRYTNSSFAGVLISLIPVVTAIGSGIFLNEKPPKSVYGWILCSVAGVAIISLSQAGLGAVKPKGILFLMMAIFASSGFYLFSRSISDEFSPFERTFISMVMGFVFYTLMAVVQEKGEFLPLLCRSATDKYVMLPVIYLSLISSVLAFVLQNYAITYLDAAKMTVFSNIVPVVSLAAGVLVLGEPFSGIYLVGIVLILVGVYKVNTATGKNDKE